MVYKTRTRKLLGSGKLYERLDLFYHLLHLILRLFQLFIYSGLEDFYLSPVQPRVSLNFNPVISCTFSTIVIAP